MNKKNQKNNFKKLIKFFIFLLISILDLSLIIFYFFISFLVYIKKLLTSKIPLSVNETIKVETYTYKKTKNKNLKLDIYYPNINKEKYPFVYFTHGGGWISGFRNQSNNVSWCKYLASRGFIVASIDYRYGYNNTMLDLLSDYKDGLDFCRINKKKFKIDVNNISLFGLSAGAHLALLYSSYFSYFEDKNELKGINSVISYYPPTDLEDILKDKNSNSLIAKFGVKQTIKDSPSKISNIYQYYSPIYWITKNMIPVLVVHGQNDKTIPFSSSVKFSKILKKHSVPYKFLVHHNADHSFDTQLKDYRTIHIIEDTIRFINNNNK